MFAALAFIACHAPAQSPRAPAPSAVVATIAPELAAINDGHRWSLVNGVASASDDDGKSVARLSPRGGNHKGSNVALARFVGVELATGTVEVDLKGNGDAQASFLGIAFGVGDGATYEAVYFRPFNFGADDAIHRAHAVQYIAWPEHTWEALRTRTPGVYEAAVDPAPDAARWFHARIEIGTGKVSVFVDDAAKPCLVVDRLRPPTKGSVALWVDSQEGAFANLRVTPR